MRLFNDVGLDNIGVNLDPANLIMYGKANPVDAIDIFGDLTLAVCLMAANAKVLI